MKKGNGKTAPAARAPSGETPFDRFTEFARKVIAVPKSEIEERERIYKEKRAAERKGKSS